MVDFICKAIQVQRSPGSWCLFSNCDRDAVVFGHSIWGGICASCMRLWQNTWHTWQLTKGRGRNAWSKKSVVLTRKEGEWEWGTWRGKEGIRVPLCPLNTDQWSENLLLCAFLRIPNSQHSALGRGVFWRVGVRGYWGEWTKTWTQWETVKIQILMGPLPLRDTETLGLSRLDT